MLWLWEFVGVGQCAVVCRVPDGQRGLVQPPWLAVAGGPCFERGLCVVHCPWGLVYLGDLGEVGRVSQLGWQAWGFVWP